MARLDPVELKWINDKLKKGGKITFAERNILNIVEKKKVKAKKQADESRAKR